MGLSLPPTGDMRLMLEMVRDFVVTPLVNPLSDKVDDVAERFEKSIDSLREDLHSAVVEKQSHITRVEVEQMRVDARSEHARMWWAIGLVATIMVSLWAMHLTGRIP